jgi:hypothetical protein
MAASASRNADGQTSGFAVKRSRQVAARVDVSVNTATIQFFLESSNDNSNWAVVYETSALSPTYIGNMLQLFPVHEGFVRVRWTISGGASTFSVKLLRQE